MTTLSVKREKTSDDALAEAFVDFVEAAEFPCVGAKAALARNQIEFAFADDIASSWNDLAIASALHSFARSYTVAPLIFRSFVLIYRTSAGLSESAFETHMWHRLQSYSDKDSLFGSQADPRVSADPTDKHFGLSFGGEGFFVVGLHPGASRPARRFKHPALVFNAHEQFTRLRAEDRYERMRRTIVERDTKLAGSPNPMLARHGEASEAKQYSGRQVDGDWRCPFERHNFAWDKITEST